jgi:signal transduction histidine kinase
MRTTRTLDDETLNLLATELEGDSESIESILLCTTHMQRTAHDILAFSKANLGLLSLSIDTFSVVDMVRSSLRMFSAEIKQHRVDVSLDIRPTLASLMVEYVRGDPHRLSQVLINFLCADPQSTSAVR